MAPSSPLFPDPFPAPWADEWFEDEYGLGMVLALGGARQCFRWIPPGRFLMGSPEDEPERDDGETQHPVILTQGYWLADTACTQALWLAIMDSNPSTFNDNSANPVENASWEDAQVFINKLNRLVPKLDARLPTEAEWEYACRAGTTTPFSFGQTIDPEQANYNGYYPYFGGREGWSRQKTVTVKSLPANPWGLYEMHGNVWEWCADWYGAYPSNQAINPLGPSEGSNHVLRGGSWFRSGGRARSACRRTDDPGGHYVTTSFRLALGLSVSWQAAQAGNGGRAVSVQTVEPSNPIEPFLNVEDEEAARQEMSDWVRNTFTPLIDFAFYEKESENGFEWPDVDISDELQSEFGEKYPIDFILKVAAELYDEGPWGLEDHGGNEDD